MERRDFVRMAAGAGAALAFGAPLSGCAAGAVVGVGVAEEAVFNPAVITWLEDLAKNIAADEITRFVEGEIDKVAGYWSNWIDGVKNSAQSYGNAWGDCYGHVIPPVVLLQVTKQQIPKSYSGNPMTDGLLACVDGGNSAVYFEPWAWHALSMYVHAMTYGLSGQNLANAQRVCVAGLIPSGTRPQTGQSPQNLVGWMTYETRNGPVEIAKLQGPDGQYAATVRATGIWDINQQPLVQQFTLPSHNAEPHPRDPVGVRAGRGGGAP